MQDSASSDEREFRAARNQALFRAVNEKMIELERTLGKSLENATVACECARLDCVKLVEIRADAYRSVRANPRYFIVLPDHVFPDVETVVESNDGYAVVEATGAGAPVAEVTSRSDGTGVAGPG